MPLPGQYHDYRSNLYGRVAGMHHRYIVLRGRWMEGLDNLLVDRA